MFDYKREQKCMNKNSKAIITQQKDDMSYYTTQQKVFTLTH